MSSHLLNMSSHCFFFSKANQHQYFPEHEIWKIFPRQDLILKIPISKNLGKIPGECYGRVTSKASENTVAEPKSQYK